jgi:LysR family transcriptional regulator, low CO2-responsive transcriptional regulator
MNYTIHQLRVFLKVVETQSITKAAEAMHMTQPAVSIQLKNFQQQFSLPLTELVGRQLHITDFGQEVNGLAQQALERLEAIQYKTRDYEGKLTGRLKISSASTGKYVIPFFLVEFMELHPGVDLILDVTNKTRVVESLKNNEIDFAVVSVPPEKLAYEEEKLIENRIYLIGNQPEPQPDQPLIFREPGSATRSAMESYFRFQPGKARKQLELTSNEAVKQAVLAGLGQSLLPLIGIKNELMDRQLFMLPAPGLPIRTVWRLIWLRGKQLSPVAGAYLGFLQQEKARILRRHFQWYLEF